MAERTFHLPDLGEGLEEAVISSWLVAEGDEVSLNQPLVEVETAKAVVEIPSPFAGRVLALHAAAGETVHVGAPLATFEVVEAGEPVLRSRGPGAAPERPSGPPREAAPRRPSRSAPARPPRGAPTPSPAGAPPAATPAVRALAKRLGVDLASVRGSGPGGRITREDVEAAARGVGSAAEAAPDVEVVPISPVRRAIAENLTRVIREVPQVTTWRTVDCTALEAFRAELGLSPLPILVRALAEVCRDHPWLNASYHPELGEIHLHRKVHVGIATDTERGLLVPVVRDVGSLGIRQVATEIARLAEAARSGALAPADMAGGTITVTNTGSYGSEAGTPILNPPQGAIVALGVIEPRALVVEGRVEARPACTLSLTFDHRLLDGATAGRAFGALVQLLEDPERLGALPR
ncbi:MAG: dihydrolipoamide acetyltransferase component of pyruvate dehydrogenase complex [Actinomycetota bacterium]|nr:MAG: dihydrolipoamide acetyltransferase component of pyruvate dehydrogenase complex [Actinomycetota bacterium]